MLQAGLFPDFKGKDTLLIWGDADGVAGLCGAISALSRGEASEIRIDGHPNLSISPSEADERPSELSRSDRGLTWTCPRTDLIAVEALTVSLDEVPSGHHFIDIIGLAGQVIISKNEYPESLRP